MAGQEGSTELGGNEKDDVAKSSVMEESLDDTKLEDVDMTSPKDIDSNLPAKGSPEQSHDEDLPTKAGNDLEGFAFPELLPPEVAAESDAWKKCGVRLSGPGRLDVKFKGPDGENYQTTSFACLGSVAAAERLCRVMYVMAENGKPKAEITAFRNEIYSKLKLASEKDSKDIKPEKEKKDSKAEVGKPEKDKNDVKPEKQDKKEKKGTKEKDNKEKKEKKDKKDKQEKKDKKDSKEKKEKKEQKEKKDKKEKTNRNDDKEKDGKRKHDDPMVEIDPKKKRNDKGEDLQIVCIEGRAADKENENINGMYYFVHDNFNNTPAYCLQIGKANRFLFFSVKRECWMIHSAIKDLKRGFAYAPYTVQRGNTPHVDASLRWHVFDGANKGFSEDSAVSSKVAQEGKNKSGGDPGEDEAGDDEAGEGENNATEAREDAQSQSSSSSSSSSSD